MTEDAHPIAWRNHATGKIHTDPKCPYINSRSCTPISKAVVVDTNVNTLCKVCIERGVHNVTKPPA